MELVSSSACPVPLPRHSFTRWVMNYEYQNGNPTAGCEFVTVEYEFRFQASGRKYKKLYDIIEVTREITTGMCIH